MHIRPIQSRGIAEARLLRFSGEVPAPVVPPAERREAPAAPENIFKWVSDMVGVRREGTAKGLSGLISSALAFMSKLGAANNAPAAAPVGNPQAAEKTEKAVKAEQAEKSEKVEVEVGQTQNFVAPPPIIAAPRPRDAAPPAGEVREPWMTPNRTTQDPVPEMTSRDGVRYTIRETLQGPDTPQLQQRAYGPEFLAALAGATVEYTEGTMVLTVSMRAPGLSQMREIFRLAGVTDPGILGVPPAAVNGRSTLRVNGQKFTAAIEAVRKQMIAKEGNFDDAHLPDRLPNSQRVLADRTVYLALLMRNELQHPDNYRVGESMRERANTYLASLSPALGTRQQLMKTLRDAAARAGAPTLFDGPFLDSSGRQEEFTFVQSAGIWRIQPFRLARQLSEQQSQQQAEKEGDDFLQDSNTMYTRRISSPEGTGLIYEFSARPPGILGLFSPSAYFSQAASTDYLIRYSPRFGWQVCPRTSGELVWQAPAVIRATLPAAQVRDTNRSFGTRVNETVNGQARLPYLAGICERLEKINATRDASGGPPSTEVRPPPTAVEPPPAPAGEEAPPAEQNNEKEGVDLINTSDFKLTYDEKLGQSVFTYTENGVLGAMFGYKYFLRYVDGRWEAAYRRNSRDTTTEGWMTPRSLAIRLEPDSTIGGRLTISRAEINMMTRVLNGLTALNDRRTR